MARSVDSMNDRARGRERLDEATADLRARPEVAVGMMFGSEGYSVRGKLFAFVDRHGDLVVKLAVDRIGELGLDTMTIGGRVMREWAIVPFNGGVERWRDVAADAFAFVDSITPKQ